MCGDGFAQWRNKSGGNKYELIYTLESCGEVSPRFVIGNKINLNKVFYVQMGDQTAVTNFG